MKRLIVRAPTLSRPIVAVLIVTIALVAFAYWKGRQEDAPPVPAVQARHAPTPPAGAPAPRANAQAQAAGPSQAAMPAVVNLFPAQSWMPPPPPPPPVSAAPPPPSTPPPLPFTVRSLWLDEDGNFYAVLSGGGREFPMCASCRKKGFLRKGDVLLDAYRIEAISRRDVQFLYLPLKRRQQLSFGEGR